MRHAMHDAVPHGHDGGEARLRLKPAQEKVAPRAVIGGLDGQGGLRFARRVMHRQICAAQADAIHLSRQMRLAPANLVEGELDAGGAAVYRQNARQSGFHKFSARAGIGRNQNSGRVSRTFTLLVGQSCRSALNSWAAQQRRPAEEATILVPHPCIPFLSETNLNKPPVQSKFAN
jgi:hypothetical protein